MLDLTCSHCGKAFVRRYNISAKRRARPQMCSKECVWAYHRAERREDVELRFWRKVRIGDEGECWHWQGRLNQAGYGNFDEGRRPQLAHRMAYQLANPAQSITGMSVCHSCDNPPCCNPAHLWLGTQAENNADRDSKGRRRSPPPRRGEACNMTKLDATKAIEAVHSAATNSELARKWGVSSAAIYNIRAGRSWAHVTGVKRA